MYSLKHSLLAFAGLAVLLSPLVGHAQKATAPTTPTAPTPVPVTVTNAATAPVPVRDVDNGARQPFYATAELTIDTRVGCSTLTTVPAGKRLVVEYASGEVSENSGLKVLDITFNPLAGAFGGIHYVPVNDPGGLKRLTFGQQVKWYFNAGQPIQVCVVRDQDGAAPTDVGIAEITGYLVDVP